jgi:hypothetical protein
MGDRRPFAPIGGQVNTGERRPPGDNQTRRRPPASAQDGGPGSPSYPGLPLFTAAHAVATATISAAIVRHVAWLGQRTRFFGRSSISTTSFPNSGLTVRSGQTASAGHATKAV